MSEIIFNRRCSGSFFKFLPFEGSKIFTQLLPPGLNLFLFGIARTLPVLIWVGIAVQCFGVISFLFFYFRRQPALPDSLGGITVIKPCFKNDDGEEQNFNSYFNQNYPGPFELLFVVSHETDPIVPIIKSYLARYPLIDAKLMVSTTRKAYWRKIDAYDDAYRVAKHDQVIISDSDSVVGPEYLSQVVACLNEPGVSLVTTPQYDTGVSNVATALKIVGNNCDVAVYAMLVNALVAKKKMAWGHSIAFRRSEFDEIGERGWERLRHNFGDDLIFPSLFAERGKKVVFRNIFCPVQFSDKSFAQMLDQQRRFAVCQRVAVGPWIHVFGLLLIPQVMALFGVVVAGASVASLKLFGLVWLSRVIVSLVFEGLIFGNIRSTVKYFWTIPIWDILKLYFVACALGRVRVSYHGHHYRLVANSRLEEIFAKADDFNFGPFLVGPTYDVVQNKPETPVEK